MAPIDNAAVNTAEKTAATTAFATTTRVRFGMAANVVRIIPLRYSPVIVIADSTISTGTPNTATPRAARSGDRLAAPYADDPCSAATPRPSTAAAMHDHSGERMVDSLMRSALSAERPWVIGSPSGIRPHRR